MEELNEVYLKIMSEEIPGDFLISTLNKIAKNPKIFGGELTANSFALSLISSYGQSRNIKYGNALERVFSKILEENGWTIEKTNYKLIDYDLSGDDVGNSDKKAISVDHVISHGENVVFIEQKIRDNHDTSKWPGQFDNYKVKYNALSKIYPDKKLWGIMWMIDPIYHRNRDSYQDMLSKSDDISTINNFVLIGNEIDSKLNEIKNEIDSYYNKLHSFLKTYHELTAQLPSINLEEEKIELKTEKLKLEQPKQVSRITQYFISSSCQKMENLFESFSDLNFPLKEIMPTGVAFKEYKWYIDKLNNSKRKKFEKRQILENSLLSKILRRYE